MFDYIKGAILTEIIYYIVGALMLIMLICGGYFIGKELSYYFFYKDLVKREILIEVKSECLNYQRDM